MNWIIAIILGLTLGLAFWGGRYWLLQRFLNDVQWMYETSLRFDPAPGNARQRVVLLYTLFACLLLVLLLIAPNCYFAIVFWLGTLWLPRIIADWAWKRRRKEIDQQLAPTIAAMCNSIRAGLTLVQAMQRLGDQAPEPIRTEFKIMSNRYAYGADLAMTIREAKERLNLPNFNLFASALLLNREMGGDVAETLQRISQSLDRLRQMKQTVEAHTSEGRTNIKVLLVAPIFMLGLLYTIDPKGVSMVFNTPQGYAVLLVAGLLTGTGVYFASRITRSEV